MNAAPAGRVGPTGWLRARTAVVDRVVALVLLPLLGPVIAYLAWRVRRLGQHLDHRRIRVGTHRLRRRLALHHGWHRFAAVGLHRGWDRFLRLRDPRHDERERKRCGGDAEGNG